ncbi:unnamed protein product [Arctia plantaginis]|uniref:Carboxylic ester hydrolase n=1 Tax=Arctia plantaginis TaxID=874455 RepID=A0A8S1AK09_ARCPL|nr:unnamed protein product [Arctia plantaginis]
MVKVKVQQGWLCGEQLDTVQGDGQYYSFKGIPYAEPPLGKLRFKAPQPPLPWNGVRQATKHGPKCPHMDIFTLKMVAGSEDCLYLNVYTPNLDPKSLLAVMVFIHGGGYKSDSGDVDHYRPDFLVSHGVVLVTINYRLEALGFLCLDTKEVPGNSGIKDQVAAMRWVKANIANFGGDPENITLFGQSAGGASTALHILSPMSKGLFKRAIPMSGVPFCDWSIPFAPQKRPYILGKQLGIDTNNPDELLEFLQEVPVEKLIDTNPTVMSFEDRNNNGMKMFHFTPVIEKDFGEEHFITEDILKLLKNGKVNDVDVFFGHNSEEALDSLTFIEESLLKEYNRYPDLIVPRKLQIQCSADQILEISEKVKGHYFKDRPINLDSMREFITFCNHSYYVYDIHSFISKLPRSCNSRRYMYIFSCVSNRNIYGNPGRKYGIRGAAHLDDLMYLFDGKEYNLKLKKNTKEYELVQLVCTVFTNFAKYGNPTPDSSLGVTGPEYDNTTKSYVDIGDALIPGTNSNAEVIKFWKSIYTSVGSEY